MFTRIIHVQYNQWKGKKRPQWITSSKVNHYLNSPKKSWFPVWRVPKIRGRWGSGGGPVESGGGSERGSGEGLVRVRWGFRWGFCEGPVRVWWGSCGGPVGDLERGSCARVRIKGPTRVWWGSGEGPMRVWWLPDDSLMTFQWLMLWFWIPILKNEVFKQLCLARLSNV